MNGNYNSIKTAIPYVSCLSGMLKTFWVRDMITIQEGASPKLLAYILLWPLV
jgi:hypothetical protein